MQHISKAKIPTPSGTMPLPQREKHDAILRIAHRLDRAAELVGLGPISAQLTFETFDANLQPKAYRKALDFLNDRKTLILHGSLGIGKTHLACAIVNRLLRDSCYVTGIYTKDDMNGVVCFTTFDDALRTLRKTYQDGYYGMGEEWYMERWRKVPVLVLDEVGQEGREKPTEFTRRIGYDIVDGRYRAGLPMLITTNKGPAGLGEWITQAATDRLFEMGEFVEMKGQSYRLRRS